MSGHLRAYIELRGHGARGPRYQVRMNKPDGMVIIDATTEPLFDAARALLSKGIKGKLQIWDSIRPYWRMQGDIERLASMTVTEGQDGIALRKYVERIASGDFDGEASQDSPNDISRPESVLQGSGGADIAALEIEASAKRRLADEYDAAQERGEVRGANERTASKPEAVGVADIGLTHKDIHEARQIRDAPASSTSRTAVAA